MVPFICGSCGTQYAESPLPPARCAICRAEGRVDSDGSSWTTFDQIRGRHSNLVQRVELDLYSIRTIPTFPVGQRALLLRTRRGNVLFGCLTVIDDATIRTVHSLGGVAAIALSHPRYSGAVVDWSHVFGGAPVYVHATNRRWLMRPDHVVRFWEGDTLCLAHGATLVHAGSHGDSGTVLHWSAGAGGSGALLTGDVVQVAKDRQRVGFLSNSRDFVPRSPDGVRRLLAALGNLTYEALYDGWSDQSITTEARAIVRESARRYIAAVSGLPYVTDPRCSLIA
jgi:hypothetical protein